MPPKKLSISRIRAESTIRSDDPDLNRPSKSSRSNRASQRYRSAAAASASSSSSSSSRAGPSRSRRPPSQPKLSARLQSIYADDIEETEIQNRFAPDPRMLRPNRNGPDPPAHLVNTSYRPLSLTQQARRDGDAFQLPSLASMCCSVVAASFDALLPSRDQFEAAAAAAGPSGSSSGNKPIRNSHTLNKASSKRKRKSTRAFGAPPVSDDDQHDYVPSDGESPPARKTSAGARRNGCGSNPLLAGWTPSELHYITRKTTEQLKLLSNSASFLLFQTLVVQAPQHLTKTLVSSCFLPSILDGSTLAATAPARAHVWLPASIPLLAHDKAAATFLVGHLTSALTAAKAHKIVALSQDAVEDVPLAALPSRFALEQPATFALRTLQLHALTRLQDATLARFFEAAIPRAGDESILRLETVSLKGCIAVGDRTVKAICKSIGKTLRYLNLDFTDVTADSVAAIMNSVPDLHTLKLGYNDNLSDKSLREALQVPANVTFLPFSKLTNLRLRLCANVGGLGLACFLKHALRTLETLDIAGLRFGKMDVSHSPDLLTFLTASVDAGAAPRAWQYQPPPDKPLLALKKLNITQTVHLPESVTLLLPMAPQLHTLMLDQMLSNGLDSASLMVFRLIVSHKRSEEGHWARRKVAWRRLRLRLVDFCGDEFAKLLPHLVAMFPRLEITDLRASTRESYSAYEGLPPPPPASASVVQHLGLPNARLQDASWELLTQLKTLRTLDLSKSNIPESILKATIKANPFLQSIDLTGCKQIRIGVRRNAFSLLDDSVEEKGADGEGSGGGE